MVTLASVVRTLRAGEASYALGRFPAVRRVHSRRQARRFPVRAQEPTDRSPELLEARPLDEMLVGLQRDAYAPGLRLRPETVEHLLALATLSPCRANGLGEREFFTRDVVEGRLGGEAVVLATVQGVAGDSVVQRVGELPEVRAAVAHYLGYEPQTCRPWLFWSYAGHYTEQERRAAGQTYFFHYDVFGYNFLYVNYYLTDVTRGRGAHVLVAGSHERKPLGMLLGSAIVDEQHVHSTYGPEAIRTIEGPAGTGFVEDTSCLHQATPPVTGDRLMLQFRYA